jgi:hypothetical protein
VAAVGAVMVHLVGGVWKRLQMNYHGRHWLSFLLALLK